MVKLLCIAQMINVICDHEIVVSKKIYENFIAKNFLFCVK